MFSNRLGEAGSDVFVPSGDGSGSVDDGESPAGSSETFTVSLYNGSDEATANRTLNKLNGRIRMSRGIIVVPDRLANRHLDYPLTAPSQIAQIGDIHMRITGP